MSPKPEEPTGLDGLQSDLLGKLQALETELLSDGFDKSTVVESLQQILKVPSCKDHTVRCLLSAITFQTAYFGKNAQDREWYEKWMDVLDELDTILQPDPIKRAIISSKELKSAITLGENIRKKYDGKEPSARRNFIFLEVFNKQKLNLNP